MQGILFTKCGLKTIHWSKVYLCEAVDNFLQCCELISYCYTIDFCFYECPQERVCPSVWVTLRICPVSKTKTKSDR